LGPSTIHHPSSSFVKIKIFPFVDNSYDTPFASNNFLLLLEEELESSLVKP
jgi:hypothetical protein